MGDRARAFLRTAWLLLRRLLLGARDRRTVGSDLHEPRSLYERAQHRLQQLGDRAAAIADLKEILNFQPEHRDALHQLATLREPVDKFFDKVMVMVDDERVRANRLAMLQTLLKEFSTIADFSEIVTEGKSSN